MPDLVSVIIPAYNARATIGAAVCSVLAQTHEDFEVIVIDDGSNDGTADVAREAAGEDARIRIISQPNGGVSVARNTGLDAANGDWIAPLDADDAFAPSRLAALLATAHAREADLVADNLLVRSRTGVESTAFPDERVRDTAIVDAAGYIETDRPRHGLHSSGFIKPLMRRAFIEHHQLRYTPGLHVGEDFEFVVRALLRDAKLVYVPEALYLYTMQAESLSHGDDAKVVAAVRSSSRNLEAEATALGRSDALRALQDRDRDTEQWFSALDFEHAVGRFDLPAAARLFTQLPSKRYGAYRVAAVLRYNVLVKLGRPPSPRIKKTSTT